MILKILKLKEKCSKNKTKKKNEPKTQKQKIIFSSSLGLENFVILNVNSLYKFNCFPVYINKILHVEGELIQSIRNIR